MCLLLFSLKRLLLFFGLVRTKRYLGRLKLIWVNTFEKALSPSLRALEECSQIESVGCRVMRRAVCGGVKHTCVSKCNVQL